MNTLELQIASESPNQPTQRQFQQWIDGALKQRQKNTELVIRIVDIDESKQLNYQYRQQDKPTNVLSFPFEALPGIDINLLGDIVICAPIIILEAQQQNKTHEAHWAHMTVHGVLHLLGFDHIEDKAAQRMETYEVNILHTLGFANPYMEEGHLL